MPAVKTTLDVVMPVRGDAPWLGAALASLSRQTRPADVVWLVDDGLTSPTGAEAVGKACLGSAFRMVANRGRGISSALNTGIQLSQADWIARMDSDDVAHPQRLESQLVFLRDTSPEVLGCGTQVCFVDGKGRQLGLSQYPITWEAVQGQRQQVSCFAHPTLLLRREALLSTPYRSALDGAEDVDLVLRLTEWGRLLNLAEPMLDYRMHVTQPNFQWRARQTALQELAFRLADSRRKGSDPLDSAPELAEAFVAWRLGMPGYAQARQAMTALRYLAYFLRGGSLAAAASCLAQIVMTQPWRPSIIRWINRIRRDGPGGLVADASPFPELNRAFVDHEGRSDGNA